MLGCCIFMNQETILIVYGIPTRNKGKSFGSVSIEKNKTKSNLHRKLGMVHDKIHTLYIPNARTRACVRISSGYYYNSRITAAAVCVLHVFLIFFFSIFFLRCSLRAIQYTVALLFLFLSAMVLHGVIIKTHTKALAWTVSRSLKK